MQCTSLGWTWTGEQYFTIKNIEKLVKFEYGLYFTHTYTYTHIGRACKCGKILTIGQSLTKPLVKIKQVLIMLLLKLSIGLIFFNIRSWEENKNVPMVNVMDSPSLNHLYKPACHHFWLEQNPTQNNLAPTQEL